MGFIDAVKTCFGKYVTFSGRAARPEYWWFVLFVVIGGMIMGALDALIFGIPDTVEGQIEDTNGPIASVFGLLTFLPLLAAGWRRMHDTGRSGMLLLLPLAVSLGLMLLMMLGIIGAGLIDTVEGADAAGGPALAIGGIGIMLVFVLQIVLSLLVLWWLTRPTEPGTNAYGPNPKEVTR